MSHRHQVALALISSALAFAAAPTATSAHAVVGARIFVNTVQIDDPSVGDEANLPLFSVSSPDGKSTVTDLNFEYDKTITENLGAGVGTDFDNITNDPAFNKKTKLGFDDPYIQLRYKWLVVPAHEFISSVAVQQAFGRAGTTGIDSGYDTTTLSGYFGKGLGDLPFDPIRPFAVTGELDYNIANTGPASGGSINTWTGGLTLQYSIPYLQSQIRDYALPPILANLTPLMELGWSSAAANTAFRPSNLPTTFLLSAGAVYTSEYYSFSTELLMPLNGAAQHGLGVIGQFHLYFDDMFPNSLGKPLI